MLDIQRIRTDPDAVREASRKKKDPADIDAILALDGERRTIISSAEELKALRNRRTEEIAARKKAKEDAADLIAEMKTVSEQIKEQDARLRQVEQDLQAGLARIPNVPHASVPHGESADDNPVVAEWGQRAEFDFEGRDHIELATALDILDFPRGAKISGAGFPVYKGGGALLERALLWYMLETHVTRHGYREIFPPFLVNAASMFGTSQLPKSADQMYYIGEDNLYCIPTAEVPVTNLHRDEILDEAQLPVKYCAYSACFRREAGSYGKDTKGFLRVHQFNKVELVKVVTPESSYDELERLRADAEAILQGLGLQYRVVELCDADLSFAAAKCYDLEAWSPVEQKWLEVSSCSNFEDFQARRLNLRYRPSGGGKPLYAHTLNGSGLATSRIMVALLETYQTARGTIRVPEALKPFMRGMDEIDG
ncbi:MAG: serine--tRNA ligase [Chitinivibrionales bacterium]|nr:serine--tRNA ligase [Chitinivibrionales bacterium]